jgi:raffinose/stachyose/melibiose transport system substrate-binding protein
VKKRLAAGHIPPLKGVKVTDSLAQKVLDAVQKAPTVQLWYDQYLPSSLSDTYLNNNQGLFGLSETPKKADQSIAAAIKKYYK